ESSSAGRRRRAGRGMRRAAARILSAAAGAGEEVIVRRWLGRLARARLNRCSGETPKPRIILFVSDPVDRHLSASAPGMRPPAYSMRALGRKNLPETLDLDGVAW